METAMFFSLLWHVSKIYLVAHHSRFAEDFSCTAMHHFVEGDEGGDGRSNCASN